MKEQLAQCNTPIYWHNCYSGGFSLWSEASYSHPAKMSPALCYRILQHLQKLGLVKEGDTILDPMAGIGTTNVCAGAMGFKSISVELEEKFVNLQKENKEYAERKLYKSLDWQMIKGDSRRLSDLLKGQGLKSVVSPPYESSLNNTAEQKGWGKLANDPTSSRYGRKSIPSVGAEYSDNPDNIGNLKDTPLKSITSPPYQDSQGHPSLGSVNKDDWGKEGKDIVKRRGLSGEYGDTEGQVGNLKSITSPPYEQSITGGKSGIEWQEEWGKPSGSRQPSQDISYGESKENIGNLKDKPLKSITSPPYEESLPNGLDRKAAEQMVQAMYDKHGRIYSKEDFEHQVELILKRSNREYGDAEGQIGKLKDKPLKAITSPPYGSDNANLQGRTDPSALSVLATTGMRGAVLSDENIGNLKDTPLKAITSPPYIDGKKGEIDADKFATHMENTDDWGNRHTEGRMKGIKSMGSGYSEDKDNIGDLPDKPLKAITSPPYGDAEKRDRSKEASNEKEKGYPRGDHNISTGYQGSDDNIGKLADKPLKSITSPPYEGATGHHRLTAPHRKDGSLIDDTLHRAEGYGKSEGQIENLPDKPLKSVMSPPYEDAKGDKHHSPRADVLAEAKGMFETYTERGAENVGNEKGESYLEAMIRVYSEILKCSDTLVTVVKNPTRKGKLRNLALDTFLALKLCHNLLYCNCETDYLEESVELDDNEWEIYKTLEESGKSLLNLRVTHKQSFKDGQVQAAQPKGNASSQTQRGNKGKDKSEAGITDNNTRTSPTYKRRVKEALLSNPKESETTLRSMREGSNTRLSSLQKTSNDGTRAYASSNKNLRANEKISSGGEASLSIDILGKKGSKQSDVAWRNERQGIHNAEAQQQELAKSEDALSCEGQFYLSDVREGRLPSSAQGRTVGRGNDGVQLRGFNNTLPRLPHEDGRATEVCRICGKEKVEWQFRQQWYIKCTHRALLFEELEQAVMIGEVYTMELDLTKAVEQPTFGYKVFITPVIDDEFGIVKFDELKQNYPNLKPNTVYYAPEVVGGTKIVIDGKRVVGRLSFFKRLSWKGGAPVANWEDIIVCIRK